MILLHQLKSRYPRYPPIFFGNAQMAVDMGQEHFLRKADPPVWWDFWWKLVVPKNWANKLPVSRWWFQSFPFLRVGTFILVCNHDPNLGGGFKGFFHSYPETLRKWSDLTTSHVFHKWVGWFNHQLGIHGICFSPGCGFPVANGASV